MPMMTELRSERTERVGKLPKIPQLKCRTRERSYQLPMITQIRSGSTERSGRLPNTQLPGGSTERTGNLSNITHLKVEAKRGQETCLSSHSLNMEAQSAISCLR